MAGLGTKLWTSGEVVTAAGVNGYLQDQTIGKFATTTARDAAFGGAGEPTLSEGMFAYTSDTDTLWFYTGSAWEVAALKPSTAQTSNRNKIINGDFKIWQRGTSFTSPSFSDYSADRWKNNNYNVAPTTYSITQQTFTAGAAPVAGYESQFFYRSTITTVGSNTEYDTCFQRIEDVRTLAGQTVTLSFWAKSDSTRTTKVTVEQNFGSGGSANASGLSFTDGTFTTTTSWQRFTFSFTLPSLSGKTIGTNSYVFLGFRQASASGSVLDIWGVQLEAGAVATPFEVEDIGTTLEKCQRYFIKWTSENAAFTAWALGAATSGTSANIYFSFPVRMRAAPSALTYSTLAVAEPSLGVIAVTTATLQYLSDKTSSIDVQVATGLTQFRAVQLFSNNSTSSFIAVSAEL
jgi:hypothetical protein